mgnify:CR=1 FL=1
MSSREIEQQQSANRGPDAEAEQRYKQARDVDKMYFDVSRCEIEQQQSANRGPDAEAEQCYEQARGVSELLFVSDLQFGV